jgi:hypothetical protein
MRVVCEAFWLQKAGIEASEYEDAFAASDTSDEQADTFRCAVADGATETSFAALWAQLLVDGYVSGDMDLASKQRVWKEHISTMELPWYAEEKARSGAFAAIVGLTLKSGPQGKHHAGTWDAWAIGDSCLVQIRGNQIVKSLPLDDWQKFNSSPALLSSQPDANDSIERYLTTGSGEWSAGDLFFLMSDAISCWFLRREAEQADAISLISTIADKDSFSTFVSAQRAVYDSDGRPHMRNDDVTLLRVRPIAPVTA